MTTNDISFENEELRGKYTREITSLLNNNGLNWHASPSIKKPEIFIRPKGNYEWDSTSSKISRISLQIKDSSISFGVSGYFPARILDTYQIYEENGYKYHDKEGNTTPKEAVDKYINEDKSKKIKGRFWLTKPVNDFYHLVDEFKKIEHIVLNGKK